MTSLTSSASVIPKYENLDEISAKITAQTPPTEREKERLLYQINKQLTEDEHMALFTDFVQPLTKKIFSVTESSTLFDLNDLPIEVFWRLGSYVEMCLQNRDRNKITQQAQSESESLNLAFQDKIANELRKLPPSSAVSDQNVRPYELMRIQALSQCGYSNFAKAEHNPASMSLFDDKRLEKTIYSDSFKHRWSQTPPTITQNPEEAEAENPDLLEIDEAEKVELDRLKTQLFKLPKIKLKSIPVNYEEMDNSDGDE